jgi:RNA polymerase sigma factor (sigma-70 family)
MRPPEALLGVALTGMKADVDEHLLFESWYLDAWPRLLAYVTVACDGDLELGRDLAAEAMARALERWPARRPEDPLAWVLTVGANLVRRHHRRRTLERRLLPRLHAGPPPELAADPMPELLVAVLALPRRQREVIALRYFCDLTQPGVATALGISTGAVAGLLNKARANLRSALDEPGEAL